MKKKNIYKIIFTIIFIFLLSLVYIFRNEIIKNEYNFSNLESIKNVVNNKEDKSELNILFTGDLMLDRHIRKIIFDAKDSTYFVNNFLGNLSIENKKYDFVIANLEGPITENKSKTLFSDGSYGKDLIFTFPTSTSEILKLLNIQIVSLANNHTDNFYYQGFKDTKSFLETNNIKYFGNPYNDNGKRDQLYTKYCKKNICIAFIGYNQFTQNNDSERIENEIKILKLDKSIDFIIVAPHWGNEYETFSNNLQKKYAHSWIDAGADMIIGGHPHVIEESEIYNGKYIYYSLGNYVFDQWFEENVKNGLAVNFKFKKEILENGEINKNIEFIKEIKVRSEKPGIKYLENN